MGSVAAPDHLHAVGLFGRRSPFQPLFVPRPLPPDGNLAARRAHPHLRPEQLTNSKIHAAACSATRHQAEPELVGVSNRLLERRFRFQAGKVAVQRDDGEELAVLLVAHHRVVAFDGAVGLGRIEDLRVTVVVEGGVVVG